MRRATFCCAVSTTIIPNFYPRSPCGERRYIRAACQALRDFYPRSPCGERRCGLRLHDGRCAISIHALLAESDLLVGLGFGSMDISIHALLAESDLPSSHSFTARAGISIHALLAESDGPLTAACTAWCNFYPRSPCGERLSTAIVTQHPRDFYPRSPCGERRVNIALFCVLIAISIHALLAESDSAARMLYQPTSYFYPRSPCGERLFRPRSGPVSYTHLTLPTTSRV